VSGPRIAILDYGMGNLRSVEKALARVGAAPEITRDHDRIRGADAVVLPGVGAFPKAMEAVRELGLDTVLRERVGEGVPTLGICLGMQLLFESSTELGGAEGLGLLQGEVGPLEAGGLKLPHIGWNPVWWERPSVLSEGLPDPCAFYHVHSFAPRPGGGADVVGTATYGAGFASVAECGSLHGVQFHPEKSGESGLRLLGNFARTATPARRAA
jgi:imidazole glycerol-phosphate synthase subunit HisH